MLNHITVGVYASGNYVVNVVRPEHIDKHIEFNKTMRPGRALFVDGKCVHNGYLNSENVLEWEGKIKHFNIDNCFSSTIYK